MGMGAAAVALLLVFSPLKTLLHKRSAPAPVPQSVVQAPAAAAPAAPVPVPAPVPAPAPVHLASFGDQVPTDAVRGIANWAVHSGDHKKMAFVIVDKKDARVWVFGPDGAVRGQTPALMGAAIGDDSVPGIGEKPLSQVRPEEKTTPAGRFIAEPGVNSHGEDIVWVSYDLAVSMHRVRPLVAAERRLQRLASLTPDDNRISFGCINLPPAFYENVLRPTVKKYGAVIYVLPETRSPAQVFNSYDVPVAPMQVAQR
ncbi:MAG: hypothetical protein HYX47_11120 [Burkholderiales bacterium]|nr:hypothetical protein [Burkholderiales bacterium]